MLFADLLSLHLVTFLMFFSYLFMSIFLVQDTCYKIGIIMIGSFLHACNLQARLCIKLYNSHVIVVDCKPFRSNNTLALYRKLLLLCKPFRPD